MSQDAHDDRPGAHGLRHRGSAIALATVLLLALAGCGGDSPAGEVAADDPATPAPTSEPSPAPPAAEETADEEVASGGSGTCAAFTPEELSAASGAEFTGAGIALSAEDVGDTEGMFRIDVGQDAEGCQWVSSDSMGFVQVATIPASAYDDLVAARQGLQGFEEVAGVGDRAYVLPGVEGGWTAHGVDGEDSVLVVLGVEGVEQDAAVALLRTALERR